MNNSKLAIESLSLTEEVKPDRTESLKEREAAIVRILEAIIEVQESKAWSSLKSEIFDGLVSRLERELRDEAKKEDPDSNKLNRLAGQLKWAERFSDLSKLENVYKVELQGIRMLKERA